MTLWLFVREGNSIPPKRKVVGGTSRDRVRGLLQLQPGLWYMHPSAWKPGTGAPGLLQLDLISSSY